MAEPQHVALHVDGPELHGVAVEVRAYGAEDVRGGLVPGGAGGDGMAHGHHGVADGLASLGDRDVALLNDEERTCSVEGDGRDGQGHWE